VADVGSLLACRSFRPSIGNSTTDNNPVTVETEPVVELKSPSFIPISRATIKRSEVACGSHAAECAGADQRRPLRPSDLQAALVGSSSTPTSFSVAGTLIGLSS
jgi:hypothetical protein